jgi:AcrR family transcriptional regulator
MLFSLAMKTNDRRFTDTRDRLFGIALELFAEKGFDATSIRDIVGRAGVSTAAFYNHFQGKDALLEAVYRHYMESRADPGGAIAGADAGELEALLEESGPVEVVIGLAEKFRVSMEDPVLAMLTRVIFMERQRNPAAAEIVRADSAKFVAFMEELFAHFQRKGYLKGRDARLVGRMAALIHQGCIEENVYYRYMKGESVDAIVKRQSEALRAMLTELIGG